MMTMKEAVEECYLLMSKDKNFLLPREYICNNAMQRSIVACAYRVYRSSCLHRLSLLIPLTDSCRIFSRFVSLVAHIPKPSHAHLYILRISCSFMYLSRPSSRCSHHSNSNVLQISLNHGVNFRAGSLNIDFRPSASTYRVAETSFILGSISTSALMNRM